MYSNSVLSRLTPLFAVVTLPLGILAALFVGPLVAAAVFVVGWLLLTPASAILFGPPSAGAGGIDDEVQSLVQERMREEIRDSGEGSSNDPVEELRDRYARGEIDEAELEKRLDALLEMEDVGPEDQESLERTIDNLDTDSGGDTTRTRGTGSPADSGGDATHTQSSESTPDSGTTEVEFEHES